MGHETWLFFFPMLKPGVPFQGAGKGVLIFLYPLSFWVEWLYNMFPICQLILFFFMGRLLYPTVYIKIL